MGTGTVSPKTSAMSISMSALFFSFFLSSSLSPGESGAGRMIGTRTPHSQFRQFSLGSFVARSWTSRPLRGLISFKFHVRLGILIENYLIRDGKENECIHTMHSRIDSRCRYMPMPRRLTHQGAGSVFQAARKASKGIGQCPDSTMGQV